MSTLLPDRAPSRRPKTGTSVMSGPLMRRNSIRRSVPVRPRRPRATGERSPHAWKDATMSSSSLHGATRATARMLVVTAARAPAPPPAAPRAATAAPPPPPLAPPDLASVQALPQRGQSADQARRDRYECHTWAIEQTGTVPRRVDAAEADATERADRVDRVVTGAAAGGALGALGRASQDEDPSHGVLSGAAIGAAVRGLMARRAKPDERDP